jgi:hypothetical protein
MVFASVRDRSLAPSLQRFSKAFGRHESAES